MVEEERTYAGNLKKVTICSAIRLNVQFVYGDETDDFFFSLFLFLANALILYPLKTTEDFFVCLLNIDWKWFNDY